MQWLYIVGLDIQARDTNALTPEQLFDTVLTHVKQWLLHSARGQDLDLSIAGAADLTHPDYPHDRRQAKWTPMRISDSRGLTVDLRQPIPGVEATFLCRASVTLLDGAVALRVAMGRDTDSGVISPARVDQIRRPQLLQRVLTDPSLASSVLNQDVDGRYVTVEPGLGEAVIAACRMTKRLPLLIIDSRKAGSLRLAQSAAHELAGLTQVVCVRGSADLVAIGKALPDAAVPPSGARLVWPYLEARHPAFDEDETARPDALVRRLLRLVAPHSVTARGRDHAWEALLVKRREAEADALRLEAAAAAAAGNLEEQVRLLEAQVAASRRDLDEYVAAFGDVELTDQEKQRLVAEKEAAEHEAEYWKSQYFDALQARPGESAWWDRAPECPDRDFAELFTYLQEHTDGALTFSPAASRSWNNCNYPFPEAMRDTLVQLAKAAEDWRQRDGQLGMQADDWLKIHHGLNSAFSDAGLSKLKLQHFEFEGQRWDRTPHIKLDDNTTPDRVGRIYFATDSTSWRFIVDHVGLKLYGL